jgi:hypothetical protein
VVVPDPDLGCEARANDIRLTAGRAWVGSAAWRAELAEVPGVSYLFRARDLENFGSAVASSEGLTLSSEAVLAILLRKAIVDSRQVSIRVTRLVVSLDWEQSPGEEALWRLAQFLSEVLELRVRLTTTEGAIESFLRRRADEPGAAGHGSSSGLLAMLEDQVWVARIARGSMGAAKLHGPAGLSPLRDSLFETCAGVVRVPSWSKHRVWRDFLTWHAGLGQAGEVAEAFRPYRIDRRFRRRAWTAPLACSALRASFATAVAGALGAMADFPAGADLWLVGDDAVKLGLRQAIEPRRQTTMSIKTQPLVRLAMAMAEMQQDPADLADERHALANYGVLVRGTQSGPKQLQTLVGKGDTFPASGEMMLSGLSAQQRRFKIDLAVQREGSAPTLLRHVYFEPKQVSAVDGLQVTLRIDGSHRLLVAAIDPRTGEPLLLVNSAIPSREGAGLAGPESVARLALVQRMG